MGTNRIIGSLGLGLAAWASLAAGSLGQESQTGGTGSSYKDRSALNQNFDDRREEVGRKFVEQLDQIETERIRALAELAKGQEGREAERTYEQLLSEAVTRGHFDAAAPAADAYLKQGKGRPRLRTLAAFVKLVDAVEDDRNDKALDALKTFLRPGKAEATDVGPQTVLAVGEGLIQHLIRAGKFDTAQQVCELILKADEPKEVAQHFQSRLARLKMLGKAAPAIAGTDVDGDKVSLDDLKGQVVLVDFWATWCPPCLTAMPQLASLQETYGDRGFRILGVNVDGARTDSQDKEAVRSRVRNFLIDLGVDWPVVLNGDGDSDFARAYGVSEIPASFLVGRDGRISAIEASGPELDAAIRKALGDDKEDKAKDAAGGK